MASSLRLSVDLPTSKFKTLTKSRVCTGFRTTSTIASNFFGKHSNKIKYDCNLKIQPTNTSSCNAISFQQKLLRSPSTTLSTYLSTSTIELNSVVPTEKPQSYEEKMYQLASALIRRDGTNDDSYCRPKEDHISTWMVDVRRVIRHYSNSDSRRSFPLGSGDHSPDFALSGAHFCHSLLKNSIFPSIAQNMNYGKSNSQNFESSNCAMISGVEATALIDICLLTVSALVNSSRQNGRNRSRFQNLGMADAGLAEEVARLLFSMHVVEEDWGKNRQRNLGKALFVYNTALDGWSKAASSAKDSKEAREAALRAEHLLLDLVMSQNTDSTELNNKKLLHLVQPNNVSFNTVIDAWGNSGRQANGKRDSKWSNDGKNNGASYGVDTTTEAAERSEAILRLIEDLYDKDSLTVKTERYDNNHLMTSMVVKPDNMSYDAAIRSWASSTNIDAPNRATAILERMLERYHEHFHNQQEVQMKNHEEHPHEEHNQYRDSPSTPPFPSMITFSSVLKCWAKSSLPHAVSRAEETLETMKRLRDEGGYIKSGPDIIAYNTLLTAYARQQAMLSKDKENISKNSSLDIHLQRFKFCQKMNKVLNEMRSSDKNIGMNKYVGTSCLPDATSYGMTIRSWRYLGVNVLKDIERFSMITARRSNENNRHTKLYERNNCKQKQNIKFLNEHHRNILENCVESIQHHLKSLLELGEYSASRLDAPYSFTTCIDSCCAIADLNGVQEILELAQQISEKMKEKDMIRGNKRRIMKDNFEIDGRIYGRAIRTLTDIVDNSKRNKTDELAIDALNTAEKCMILMHNAGYIPTMSLSRAILNSWLNLDVNRAYSFLHKILKEFKNDSEYDAGMFQTVMAGYFHLLKRNPNSDMIEIINAMEEIILLMEDSKWTREKWIESNNSQEKRKKIEENSKFELIAYNMLLQTYSRIIDMRGIDEVNGIEKCEKILNKFRQNVRSYGLYKKGKKVYGSDVMIYGVVLKLLAQSNLPDAGERAQSIIDNVAADILNTEDKPNVKLNMYMLNLVLKAYQREGTKEAAAKAESLLLRMEDSSDAFTRALEKCRDDTKYWTKGSDRVSYNTVIAAHAAVGTLESAHKAEELLQLLNQKYMNIIANTNSIHEKEVRDDLKPDIYCYNTIISAWLNTGVVEGFDRAEWLLKMMLNKESANTNDDFQTIMESADVKPDNVTFKSVIHTLSSSGYPDRAENWLDIYFENFDKDSDSIHSKDKTVIPGGYLFSSILRGYSRCENPKEAERILFKKDEYNEKDPKIFANVADYKEVFGAWLRISDPIESINRCKILLEKMLESNEIDGCTMPQIISCYNMIIKGIDKRGDVPREKIQKFHGAIKYRLKS